MGNKKSESVIVKWFERKYEKKKVSNNLQILIIAIILTWIYFAFFR